MPAKLTQNERLWLLKALGERRRNAVGGRRLSQLLGYSEWVNQIRLRNLLKECIKIDDYLIVATTADQPVFYDRNRN
jgi:hypothetical protein